MDTMTSAAAAENAIVGGLSPDEVRFKYFDKGPTSGGASPMMQEQNYSLAALAKRDAGDPFAVTAPERITAPAPTPLDDGQPVPGALPAVATPAAKFARPRCDASRWNGGADAA